MVHYAHESREVRNVFRWRYFKDWFSLCWIYLDSFLADAVTEELDFVGEEGTLLRVESYSSVFQPL